MGAVAAIAGPILGGVIGASGASDAANTQAQGATNAAQIAANAQLQGLQFIQGQEAPYNQAGQLALGRYEQLLGLGGGPSGSPAGGASNVHRPAGTPAASVGGGGNFDISSYLKSNPAYQFQLQQGLAGVEGSAAARGGALSGNALQGVQQYGAGLASQEFQQYMSQLAGLTGVGQAAASGVATAGGNLIPGAGASIAGGVNASANATAAGQMGITNAIQSALGSFNSPTFQSGLTNLFNPNPQYDQGPTIPQNAFGP